MGSVLESIEDLALHLIFSKLGPKNTAIVACVSKKLNFLASDEVLWLKFCSEELQLSTPLGPLGETTPSFKETYRLWHEAFSMYPWPLVKRAKRCWDQIQNWLRKNFPEVQETVQKGASEAEIEELEEVLEVKLPLPTRILYRLHDGQNIGNEITDFLPGLIGGYSFYEELVNVYLFPLSDIIRRTKPQRLRLGLSKGSKYILVAASITDTHKLFFLNCANGQLYVGTKNLYKHREMMPCVPDSLISSVPDLNGAQQQDAMLLWLEEHGRRLQNGIIKLGKEENIRSISLFHEEPPLCSAAVTNGVQIRASALFVPEFSDLKSESNRYLFTYSIRMCLQQEGCIIRGMAFSSCQLYYRHWIIHANDRVIADVSGEGVIGMYPLLHAGGKEFVYQSCSSMPSAQGTIEGAFRFVPNSMLDPKGKYFEVEVARFPLQLPDYIF